MGTVQIDKHLTKALGTYIKERDLAIANITDILQSHGVIPEMVENINLDTGIVTLKGAVEEAPVVEVTVESE